MIGNENRWVLAIYRHDEQKKGQDEAEETNLLVNVSAKVNYADCGEENLLPSHIAKHAGRYNNFFNTVIALIKTNDSLSNLAGVDDEILKKCWILYKNNFKFKPRRPRNIII